MTELRTDLSQRLGLVGKGVVNIVQETREMSLHHQFCDDCPTNKLQREISWNLKQELDLAESKADYKLK